MGQNKLKMGITNLNNIKIRTSHGVRAIGKGHPVFVIAEMSANHNQSFSRALRIIDAAAKAGADAVKLQTYTADTITIDSDKKYFQVKVNKAWKGQTLHSLYKKAYTPWDWQPKLKKYAESKGLVCFSSPFDDTAVDFLEKMDIPMYKVASFEVIDIPLLKKIGTTKKPVIISRGMASLPELKSAVETLLNSGCPNVAILHCVSSYPANYSEMNLATIPDLIKKFKNPIGLSDHSLGIETAVAAVTLGATIIEKHLALSRKDGGPDSAFSLEPREFKDMVQAIRNAEKIVGKPFYGAEAKESENVIFRKSLFVIRDMKAGERFTIDNVRSIRPGHGLEPKYFEKVLGKRSSISIERGTPLSWKLIKK